MSQKKKNDFDDLIASIMSDMESETSKPHKTSADDAARPLFELFEGFINAGFTRMEAMYLVGKVIENSKGGR